MIRVVSLLIASLFVVTAFGAGAFGQDPPGEPGRSSCLPGNALEGDNVRIWFHGFKGFVKVFDETDEIESHLYQYTTGKIFEKDTSGESIAEMNLQRAFPQSSGCTVEETEDGIRLNLTIEEDVRLTRGGFIGQAEVVFSYAFNESDNGAKFDLIINDWPWQTEDGLIGYAFTVQSAEYDMEVAENGIGFQNGTGDQRGHLEWADNATAYYEDGTNETADVESDTDEIGNKVDVTLRFENVTAGYETLEYDPWASMGDWIIILNRLYSLDAVEGVIPLGLYRTVRSLI